MSEENAPNDTNEPDLPAIDFQSPGRFASAGSGMTL